MIPRLLLVCALLLTSGCSMVLVKGPPSYIPADEPVPEGACTIDRTIPLVDALGAGGSIIAALTSSHGDVVRFGAVAGAALGYSSYSGFRKVRRCRARVIRSGDFDMAVADTTFMRLFPDLVRTSPAPYIPLGGSSPQRLR